MNNKKYYLAYGSNLNIRQMGHRCPKARVIGSTTLPNYKLTFRGNFRGAGVANIEPAYNESVPVGVWEIAPSDEWNLDSYEGYPFLYDKRTIPVKIGGRTIRAMAYVMTPGYDYARPSASYLTTISVGYDDFGFDEDKKELLFKAALDATAKQRD